jgi:hypothetical protein
LCLIFSLHVRPALDLHTALIKPGLTVLPAIGVFYALHTIGSALSLLGAVVTLSVGCCLFASLTPQDLIWFRQSFRWVIKKMSSVK